MRHQTTRVNKAAVQRDLRRIHAVLIVLDGHDIGRDYQLRGAEYIIGRDSDCDICIPEEVVSRQHAKILVEYSAVDQKCQCRLVDMGSTNKTIINNNEVTEATLVAGDKIQIGSTVLKYELLDAEDVKYHDTIRRKIKYDALTGLLTKESWLLAMEHELERCKEFNLTLSVMMMDLDRFKLVNDTYGHPAGSHTLSEVGSLILGNLRKTDVSARYGGEEFLAYLREQPKKKALTAANNLRKAIEKAIIEFEGYRIATTISIGIAQFPDDGTTIDALISAADLALYDAKNGGRNKVCLAGDS